METATILRARAQLCRDVLSRGAFDSLTIERLTALAHECEAKAAEIERAGVSAESVQPEQSGS